MKSAPSLEFIPTSPDLSFEVSLWEQGSEFVAGLDEAGRGALAGPVFAAAVIFPCNPGLESHLVGVRDSKQMTPSQREYWAEQLKIFALAWGIGAASHEEIDAVGILPATRLAMRRALEATQVCPQHLLLDYIQLPESPIPQTALVKGDRRSLSIAAASILAKTARDDLLRQLDKTYPEYGFASHKGYGTLAHRSALERLGPCSIHRYSFAPVRAARRKVKVG